MNSVPRSAALAVLALVLAVGSVSAVVDVEVCATPGKDGAGGTLAGVVNRYHPGTATAAAGSTTLSLGTATGAATAIAAGDLLLVIQMQDAAIDSTNTGAYGDGVAGDPATGSTTLNNVGRYEYVEAQGAVVGGLLTIAGKGTGGGLINTYTVAAATGSQGARGFQVVRVPQYTTATFGATLTALAWDGSTGAILAIDVRDTLSLGSVTVNVNGLGFRGAGGEQEGGGPGGADTDYVTSTADNRNGGKGEGIAGTPRYVNIGGTSTDLTTEGYPNGARARGAPGNAGGGGTDGNGSANQDNAGGGGGGNGGTGGQGGNTSSSNLARGGFGGAPFTASAGRVIPGGGGGAGCRNGPGPSHGAAGGGIVLIRTGSVAGSGTISANGASAPASTNDGAGGGGAGGSIVCVARSSSWVGLTATANGGTGGNADLGGGNFGPGGGGAGGVILLSGSAASLTVTGGNNGLTGASIAYGASPGTAGVTSTALALNDIPGVDSGADCHNNDAPENTVPGTQTTAEDTALVLGGGAVSINDPDAGAAAVQVTLTATNGAVTLSTLAGLTFTTGDGSGDALMVFSGSMTDINAALNGLSFLPSLNFTGTASLQIVTNDLGNTGAGGALTDTDSFNITVTAVNDAPVAVADAFSIAEDGTLTVGAPGVLANDSDVDLDALSAVLDTTTTNGLLALNANGSFTYTPAANFTGSDSFTYHANDGLLDSGTVTVTITVTAVNDAPVANDDPYGATEDTPLVVAAGSGVLVNDTDTEFDPLTAVLVTPPSNGLVTLNANGSFTYTPSLNFNGIDTFTYLANDGGLNSAPATVSITVSPINDAPVANDDALSVAEEGTLNVAAPGVLTNDTDVDLDSLTAVLVTPPAIGSLTFNADGSFSYTPPLDFNGPVTFTYRANDSLLNSNVATVTITVTPVNDAPVANPDAEIVPQDSLVVVHVLDNDTDIEGNTLSTVSATDPPNGTATVNGNGTITYTPDTLFNGIDTFTYTISDGNGGTDSALVTITVTAATDVSIMKTASAINALPGDPLTYTLVVANAGPNDAVGVTVVDSLPPGLSYQSSSATQGSYNPATGIWTVGGVLNGGSATLTISVLVGASVQPSVITNVAGVGSGVQFDSDATNNVSAAPVTIGIADLILQAVGCPAGVAGVDPVCVLAAGSAGSPYLLQLSATGGVSAYSFSIAAASPSFPFNLDPQTGLISGTPPAGTYDFTAQVADAQNPADTDVYPFQVVIAPAGGSPVINTFPAPPAGTVGVAYSYLFTASGGQPPYLWSVTGALPAGLALNPFTGELAGTPLAAGSFPITMNTGTASQGFTITIGANLVAITTLLLPPASVDSPYSHLIATQGGVGPTFTWSTTGTLPAGLLLAGTGPVATLSGTPTAPGTFVVEVTATDDGQTGVSDAQTYIITVSAAGAVPLEITTPSLPPGTTGQPYVAILSAIGGDIPYTWSLVSGLLPAGLTLDPVTGIISGVPMAAGSFQPYVGVMDAALPAATDTASLTLTISGPPVIVTPTPLPDAVQLAGYAVALDTIGGTLPFAWSLTGGAQQPDGTWTGGGLPAGLALHPATGTISGAVTDPAGSYSFVVFVSDALGASDTQTYDLDVLAPIAGLTVLTTSLPRGTTGIPYGVALLATGGTVPYAWSVASGTPPAWATLDGSGLLFGTPDATGTTPLSFTVDDGSTTDTSAVMDLVVLDPLRILTLGLPEASVNQGYGVTLLGSGGQAPYAWSISAGTLPGGLSLDAATGLITGSPAQLGTFVIKIRLEDAFGTVTERQFPLVVKRVIGVDVRRAGYCSFSAAGTLPGWGWLALLLALALLARKGLTR